MIMVSSSFSSNCDCPMRIMMIKVFCSDISCERCVAGALFSRLISERTEELNCHNKCRNEPAADDFFPIPPDTPARNVKTVDVNSVPKRGGAGNKKRTRKCPSIDGCGSEKTQDSINCELKKCPSRIGELFLRYKIK